MLVAGEPLIQQRLLRAVANSVHGEFLRELRIDPEKIYQGQGA